MSKIAILTDCHFGVHGNSEEFLTYQEKFFNDLFFPYLKKEKIKTILDLGDTFESRKNISYNTLNESKKFFFDRIEKEGYNLKIIVGNHSTYYKHDIDVNSPKLLFDKYSKIDVIDEPKEFIIGGTKFLLVPWINNSNQKEVLRAINNTDAHYLLGHFEISGMKLHKNWQFSDGLDHSILNKFKEVWSGHYHLKLHKDNFIYLGTPYQMDWGDINHEKGFYVFDNDTQTLEFIENKMKIYHIIEYVDSIDVDTFDYSIYSNSYIRVILNESIVGYTKFDLFLSKLGEVCYDIKVDEKFYNNILKTDLKEKELNDDVSSITQERTIDTIKKFTEDNEIVDNNKLFIFMEKAYNYSKELMNA